MTDPIADMLTRIRNAVQVSKSEVVIPHSKIKEQIAEVLRKEGYISSYRVDTEGVGKNLVVQLKYMGKRPAITSLKRVSTPGRRSYTTKDTVPVVLNGLGISIISTSKGLFTGQEAKKQGIGGEIICEIY